MYDPLHFFQPPSLIPLSYNLHLRHKIPTNINLRSSSPIIRRLHLYSHSLSLRTSQHYFIAKFCFHFISRLNVCIRSVIHQNDILGLKNIEFGNFIEILVIFVIFCHIMLIFCLFRLVTGDYVDNDSTNSNGLWWCVWCVMTLVVTKLIINDNYGEFCLNMMIFL